MKKMLVWALCAATAGALGCAPGCAAKKSSAKGTSTEVMTAGSGVAGESGDFSKAVTYTVVKGDSLWKIAQKVYGDGACWPRIQEANKTLLKDSKDLIAGTVLTIPR